jgi:hypothetical protein
VYTSCPIRTVKLRDLKSEKTKKYAVNYPKTVQEIADTAENKL